MGELGFAIVEPDDLLDPFIGGEHREQRARERGGARRYQYLHVSLIHMTIDRGRQSLSHEGEKPLIISLSLR